MTRARVAALAFAAALFVAAAGPASAQPDSLTEANQLFKQGEFDRAFTDVEQFLKAHPKDARGRFLKGLILTEQKKTEAAIGVFKALTEDYPELPEPYNNLAVLYAGQGHYDKAREALEMAIRTHPSYATAHENLGDIYAKMASEAYDKALQLDRGNAAAQTKLNLIRELFTAKADASAPASAGAPGPKTPPRVAAAPTPPPSPPPAPSAPPPADSAPPPAAAPAPSGPQMTTAPGVPPPQAGPSPSATPAPAAAPRPKAEPPQTAEREEDVLRAVYAWAKAWSDNDVKAYLAHYAADFRPPAGMSRQAWEAQRRARVAKPKQIHVEIEAPHVTFDGANRATVKFLQHYRSNTFKSNARKTLVMTKSDGEWLIQDEDVGD